MDAFSSSFLPLAPQPILLPLILHKSSSLHFLPLVISHNKPTRTTTKTFSKSSKIKPQLPPPPPSPYGTTRTDQPNVVPMILDLIEDMINKFVDPPTRPSVDPKLVLSGNFAPVEELPPTKCEVVEGVLPSCLDGAYIRNGPNPQFFPRGPYHMFDGDGMLHIIRISNGKATLCSRFVKTNKYIAERKVGTNVIPNIFAGVNGLVGFVARGTLAVARVVAGQFDPSNGFGLGNTSIALFGNRLYALCESDLPYEVKITPDGDIQTIGRSNFDGSLFPRMTAHPKVDPYTGEAFAFHYAPFSPYLTYFRFDSKGSKHKDVPIFSMLQPSYLHDFVITNKYAIFPDIQIQMDPMRVIMRGGPLLYLDPTKVSRVGVIPRYAGDDKAIKWFEVPKFNILHAINAWDEVDDDGNEVIVIIVTNLLSPEQTLDRLDLIHSVVEKVRIDLKIGLVSRQRLSPRNLEFGVINPAYVGRKNKYVYAAIGDPLPNITGVVKLDVSMAKFDARECVVASRMYELGCYGGEPYFVASNLDDQDANEDDGYVISYVHNENTGESRFIVMDAKSPCLDVVASVKLPQRVPYGFHGLFVGDKDLKRLM